MSSRIFQFGSCTVDTATRELVRDGALVPLSPKVFDCLAYLLSNRDRAVGRDELISAVWGRVDVSDTLLGQTILKARRAIGDDGNEQNAIRTIPRFGYRWVALARVEAVEPGKDSPSIGTATPGVEATKSSLHPASPTATPIEPVTAIESRTDPEPVADTLTPPWPWVAAALAAILVVVVVAGFWPRGKREAGAPAAASNLHPSTTPVLAVPARSLSWETTGSRGAVGPDRQLMSSALSSIRRKSAPPWPGPPPRPRASSPGPSPSSAGRCRTPRCAA